MSARHPYLNQWTLMPAKPGTCPECATAHAADQPHNAQSLFYQFSFYGQHGRWPNWKDAMAHCSQVVQACWTNELTNRGVDVAGGKVNPERSN